MQEEVDHAYFEGHRAGSRHAWRAAGGEEQPPGWEAVEEAEKNADPATEENLKGLEARVEETAALFPKLLEKEERELVVEARTVWDAFAGFCQEELGLRPQTLIEAYFEPMSEQLGRLKALVSDPDAPDPDPERLAEYGKAIGGAWATFVESHA